MLSDRAKARWAGLMIEGSFSTLPALRARIFNVCVIPGPWQFSQPIAISENGGSLKRPLPFETGLGWPLWQ